MPGLHRGDPRARGLLREAHANGLREAGVGEHADLLRDVVPGPRRALRLRVVANRAEDRKKTTII